MTDTTDPIAAARALLDKVPPLFIDLDGDLCREGDGYNLVGCAATDDEPPFGPLNPVIWSAIPTLRDMVATLADALEAERAEKVTLRQAIAGGYNAEAVALEKQTGQALVAAAFAMQDAGYSVQTPADAQAALEKLLTEARLEGWRAGREAAAEEAERYDCSEGGDDFTAGVQSGYRDAAQQIVEGIRALPEPKENSND